jgi:apolipoprotein N-acyltransferase
MNTLSRKKRVLLSVLSGLLMVVCFPFTGSLTLLVFVAWIPLLFVEQSIHVLKRRSAAVYFQALVTFLLYNVGTTWWIWNADHSGAILAIVLNSIFMAFVFFLFHRCRKWFSQKGSGFLLIVFWLGFEFVHYHWEFSWPWLNFGNVFSITPSYVQWYSVTGVFGGSFWVLLVNLLGFQWVNKLLDKDSTWRSQIPLATYFSLSLFGPLLFSLYLYHSFEEEKNPVETIIVQPNIDPYNEKFDVDLKTQMDKIFKLVDENIEIRTDFVIAPETAISTAFYEDQMVSLPFFHYLIKRKEKWFRSSFLTGATSSVYYKKRNSIASIKLEGEPGFVEHYNTSLLIDPCNSPSFVHKSKLVLGVEKIPFTSIFPGLENLAISLGGASGSLGIEKEPKIMKTEKLCFAPSVCYESIYGEFIAQQVMLGAELIFVITNDGWWGNTPGFRQHASFSRLRAIENRRSIARSANTGISCIINQRGDVLQESEWWIPCVLKGAVNKNSEITFYSENGDYIGRICAYGSIFLVIFSVFLKVRNRRKSNYP